MQSLSVFAQHLIEAWNTHDFNLILPFYAATYTGIDVGDAMPHIGPDGVRQNLVRYFRAFPDLAFHLDGTIAEDNRLSLEWTATGTHGGELMRIPATGRAIRVPGISLLTIICPEHTPRIVSARNLWDMAGLLRTLGLLPRL